MISKFKNKVINYLVNKRFGKHKLQNFDFTIICNNCIAGIIYKELAMKFSTPTINLYFYYPDYIKFLSNFEYYLNQKLVFVNVSKYNKNIINYPIGILHDIEIHFLHYENDFHAKSKWEERVKRINFNNLFIIGSDRDNCNKNDIINFDKLPFANKIFFSAKNYKNLKSVLWISKYKNENQVGDLIKNQDWLNYFDLIYWLNTGNIKRFTIFKFIFNFIFGK